MAIESKHPMYAPTEEQLIALSQYFAGRDVVVGEECRIMSHPVVIRDGIVIQPYVPGVEPKEDAVVGWNFYLYWSMDYPGLNRRYQGVDLASIYAVPTTEQFESRERDIYMARKFPDEPPDLWHRTFDEIADWQGWAFKIRDEAYAEYDAAQAAKAAT